jgi:hypothetical protein
VWEVGEPLAAIVPGGGRRDDGTETGFDNEECDRDDFVAEVLSVLLSLSDRGISKMWRVDLSDVTAMKDPEGENEMEKMVE